jgi:hypothetical protein
VQFEHEEKNSVAIASNESFSGWTKTFIDPRLCTAIVDRLACGDNLIQTGTRILPPDPYPRPGTPHGKPPRADVIRGPSWTGTAIITAPGKVSSLGSEPCPLGLNSLLSTAQIGRGIPWPVPGGEIIM